MKISMLIDSLGSGGAQRQFVALANGLSRRGHQVTVFCYHDLPFFEKSFDQIVTVKVMKGRRGWMRKLKMSCLVAIDNADVRISFLDIPNLLNILLSLVRPGARRIVSERNTDPVNPSFRKRFILNIYRLADCVVPNSRAQCDQLLAKPYLEGKVKYIVNAVNTDVFFPSEVEMDRFPKSSLRGVVVARYDVSKNVFLPLEWVAKHSHVPVTFKWYGEQFKRADLNEETVYERAVKQKEVLKLDGISLFGPSSNIAEVYRESDFMCLPSFYEGTANVICEAMASGLPVICSDVSDNALLVEDGVNGFLFDPNSLDSFDGAISKLLALSIEERKAMGRRNRAKAISLFSMEHYINEWEAVVLEQRSA